MKMITEGVGFNILMGTHPLTIGEHGLLDVSPADQGKSLTIEVLFTPEQTNFQGGGALEVFTIDADRNIMPKKMLSEPTPGTSSFVQRVQVRPLEGRPGHFTSHLDNSVMFAHVSLWGVIQVWVITVIVQQGKKFFAIVHKTHNHQVYRFKEGSSQYWTAVQVRNHRYAIASFEYRENGGAWQPVGRAQYNYFIDEAGMGPGPIDFRVTDVEGNVVEDVGLTVQDAAEVAGAGQFPACMP